MVDSCGSNFKTFFFSRPVEGLRGVSGGGGVEEQEADGEELPHVASFCKIESRFPMLDPDSLT